MARNSPPARSAVMSEIGGSADFSKEFLLVSALTHNCGFTPTHPSPELLFYFVSASFTRYRCARTGDTAFAIRGTDPCLAGRTFVSPWTGRGRPWDQWGQYWVANTPPH